MVNGSHSGIPPIDPFPAAGSAMIGAGDAAFAVADDFNGSHRSGGSDAGAYAFQDGGNPGWVIAAGFKPALVNIRPNPPEDLQTD
jgi:hypothetical protein